MQEELETKNGIQGLGLTDSEVRERKERFGANQLPEPKGRRLLSIYLSQFKNPLIYIILVAGLISFALHEYSDMLIILGVVLVDSVLGFFQEYQAEKAVAALRRLLKPKAVAIRDGRRIEIQASEIVPDDVVALNDGDRVPADGDLVEAVGLNLNEAILTGESEPVAKRVSDPVYMGTTVFTGRGLMMVKSIGRSTELGKIAVSISEVKDESTPLQEKLHSFGSSLTRIVVLICVSIFVIGLLSGIGLLEMLEVSIVLAIAAIPEGLPIAVTMILVLGMRSILRRKGLVKRLLAVETLGSVTVICTDKTGTLTEGVMRVVRADFRSPEMASYVLILCNNSADSLEAALWNYVKARGVDPEALSNKYARVSEVPFSSEKKYMLTINRIDQTDVALLKGAPDVIQEFCNLEPREKQEITTELEDWAESGLRVLGLAYKSNTNLHDLSGFTWLGLVGIEDPVRPSVKDAVALCQKAGIKVKIITGDYRGTSEKVATSLGLSLGPNQVIDGKQLEDISESELDKVIDDIVVFCRVVPHQKLKIVSALQRRREVVAMIGDGINDAPALKKSNIGVSLGNATEVAQEAASLILLDGNFGTLVNTVEEGRIIFENSKKVVAYVLSNSFAEIFVIFGAMILGWPAPLTVVQILWIHLICDGPSDIVLGFEREHGLMEKPPKNHGESIFSRQGKILVAAISLVSAVVSLIVFYYFWRVDGDLVSGRTIVFTILAIQSLVYIFSYRSLRLPVFRSNNFFSNKWLFAAVTFGFAQQVAAIYAPFLNQMLDVAPLHPIDWFMVMTAALGMILLAEAVKYFEAGSETRVAI